MKELGQSLLEVTIAIGIAVVVLSTLTFTTLSGYKNSQVSQNQTTATKLAQDAMDQVRSMRDRSSAVCYSSTIKDWPTLFVNASTCSGGCNFIIQPTGTCFLNSSNTVSPYLLGNSVYQTITSNPRFSRIIKITNSSNNTVSIQVLVKWDDTGGTHYVNLVTNLGPK